MIGYKLTIGQKKALENQLFKRNQYFHPVKDKNGDWFIFEEEMENCVKNKGWRRAMEAEYVPPIRQI